MVNKNVLKMQFLQKIRNSFLRWIAMIRNVKNTNTNQNESFKQILKLGIFEPYLREPFFISEKMHFKIMP